MPEADLIDQLSHRHIEVFRAVMQAGQVTRAAEALRSSQPTVSRELARLEHILGYALFDRIQGRLRPTVRARALYDEVERAWQGLARVQASARELRQFATGRLHLDISDEELAARLAQVTPPEHPMNGGYQRLYVNHVLQADQGCDGPQADHVGAPAGDDFGNILHRQVC